MILQGNFKDRGTFYSSGEKNQQLIFTEIVSGGAGVLFYVG